MAAPDPEAPTPAAPARGRGWRVALATTGRIPPAAWLLTLAPLVLACARPFARAALSMRFLWDDWLFLWYAQHPVDYLRRLPFMEVFRPAQHVLYFLTAWIFGIHPRPFAALVLAAHVGAAVLGTLALRAAGLSLLGSAAAVVLATVSSENWETLCFFSVTPIPFMRLWGMALLFVFLREERPRRRLWLPLLVLTCLSHEQGFAFPMLVLLGVWYRDGLAGLRGSLRNPARREMVLGFVLLLAGRSALFHGGRFLTAAAAPEMRTHNLGFAAVRRSGAFLLDRCRHALELITGYQEGTGWLLVTALLLLALAPVVRWRAVPRLAAFCLGWVVVSYGIYFFATAYVGGYFVAVSLVGVYLLVTESLGAAVECARAPVVLRALVAVMALAAFSRQPTTSGFLAPEFSDELVAAVRGGYARGPDGVAHLLLLEDTDLGDRWGVPAYRHLMTTTGTRSELLEVVFPERPMRVSLLSARHRPWMTPRPGDLVLRVTRQGPRGDVGYVNRTRDDSFHVVREPAPATGDPVPEALRAGDAGLAPGLAAAARAYWAAYRAGDVAASAERAGSVGDLAGDYRGSPEDEPRRLLVEAVLATRPPVWPGEQPGAWLQPSGRGADERTGPRGRR